MRKAAFIVDLRHVRPMRGDESPTTRERLNTVRRRHRGPPRRRVNGFPCGLLVSHDLDQGHGGPAAKRDAALEESARIPRESRGESCLFVPCYFDAFFPESARDLEFLESLGARWTTAGPDSAAADGNTLPPDSLATEALFAKNFAGTTTRTPSCSWPPCARPDTAIERRGVQVRRTPGSWSSSARVLRSAIFRGPSSRQGGLQSFAHAARRAGKRPNRRSSFTSRTPLSAVKGIEL